MIAQAVRSCADRGVSYLVYEQLHLRQEKRATASSHFKESNGFRRMDLPRYYVPLTPLGQCRASNLGLHRRLVDYCPEQIMATASRIQKLVVRRGSYGGRRSSARD